MTEDEFVSKTLEFDTTVQIDTNNIILGGHSMGGMTSIETSKNDNRIKAIFTLDPWLWCRLDEIRNKDYGVSVPQFHIVTEHFPETC